jgi:hypothetical protein
MPVRNTSITQNFLLWRLVTRFASVEHRGAGSIFNGLQVWLVHSGAKVFNPLRFALWFQSPFQSRWWRLFSRRGTPLWHQIACDAALASASSGKNRTFSSLHGPTIQFSRFVILRLVVAGFTGIETVRIQVPAP